MLKIVVAADRYQTATRPFAPANHCKIRLFSPRQTPVSGKSLPNRYPPRPRAIARRAFSAPLRGCDSPSITGATVRLQKSYAKDSGYDDGILMTESSSGNNLYTGSVSYVAGQTYYIRAYVVTADGSAFTSNVVTVNP